MTHNLRAYKSRPCRPFDSLSLMVYGQRVSLGTEVWVVCEKKFKKGEINNEKKGLGKAWPFLICFILPKSMLQVSNLLLLQY